VWYGRPEAARCSKTTDQKKQWWWFDSFADYSRWSVRLSVDPMVVNPKTPDAWTMVECIRTVFELNRWRYKGKGGTSSSEKVR
jgi:hypothetical protein